MRAAQAGRTDVRVEALRAAISFGTAEAVPLTWTRAAIISTPHASRFMCDGTLAGTLMYLLR
ncbi:MAG: hypothetical protein EPN45_02070 [Rhizobiaceae bacterium]|nr:MAG: hypothetical protein EPN45_02070 [Rhizobiaceae bacterium]